MTVERTFAEVSSSRFKVKEKLSLWGLFIIYQISQGLASDCSETECL
jgi:hypothetical protein